MVFQGIELPVWAGWGDFSQRVAKSLPSQLRIATFIQICTADISSKAPLLRLRLSYQDVRLLRMSLGR